MALRHVGCQFSLLCLLGMWWGNENQICGWFCISGKWLNSHHKMFTWTRLDCSDLQSLHFWDYFYTKQTVHFPPVFKSTIKELVVCNHRIWTKAKGGQLFTCQRLILRWSLLLQPCPTPPPPPWGMTQAGRGNKSSECQTVSCPNSSLQKLQPPPGDEAMSRYLAMGSLQTDIFKTRSPKNRKKLNPFFM